MHKLLLLILAIPYTTFAATNPTDPNSAKGLLDQVADKAGYTTLTTETTRDILLLQIAGAINLILGFLGVIFVILIIYAGFLYMTARGNDEQVGRAQNYIKNAIIGLIIILTAYAFTIFLIQQLTSAVFDSARFLN